MSFLGCFLQCLLHSSQLLQLIGILWFLDSLNLDDESITSLNIHGRCHLNLLVCCWLAIISTLEHFIVNFLQGGHGNSLVLLILCLGQLLYFLP